MTAVDPDLKSPIQSFTDTHFGIMFQLDRLGELPALLAPFEIARKIAGQSMEYFKKTMHEHHQAEERVLFPAVLQSAQPGKERIKVESLIEVSEAQHSVLEALWKKIESDLNQVAKGMPHKLDTDVLKQLVNHYREHARMEEGEFLPLAQIILSRNPKNMEALGLAIHLIHPPYFPGHI
jgi:hemerythrin-like domain-containing protein